MKIQLGTLLGLSALICGCSLQQIEEDKYSEAQKAAMVDASIQDEVVMRSIKKDTGLSSKASNKMVFKKAVPNNAAIGLMPVTMAGNNVSILRALSEPFKKMNVVARDTFVDLNLPLKIRASKMKFEDYIKLIESLSGYALEYKKGAIYVSGNKSEIKSVGHLVDSQAELDEIVKTAKAALNPSIKGSFVGLIDNNHSLVVSGLPQEVDRISKILDKAIESSNKLIAVSVQIYDNQVTDNEELIVLEGVVRNGRHALLSASKTLTLPASYESDSGKVEMVSVGINLFVAPKITEKNKIALKVIPKISSVTDSSGMQVLNAKDLQSLVLSGNSFDTDLVVYSGQKTDISASMQAVLKNGVKIIPDQKGDAKKILFDKKSSKSRLEEFRISLAATVTEPRT